MCFFNFNIFQENNFLITSDLGFIGLNLISALLSEGIKPIILDYIPKDADFDYDFVPLKLKIRTILMLISQTGKKL